MGDIEGVKDNIVGAVVGDTVGIEDGDVVGLQVIPKKKTACLSTD